MTAGDEASRTASEADADFVGTGGRAGTGDQTDGAAGALRPPRHPTQAEALTGPFTTRQLLRLDEALRVADTTSGLIFSVYVGGLDEPVRGHAEKLHGQLSEPGRSVLIAISPNQRMLEIVTGTEARRKLSDRACRLAAMSMVAAFGGGDLAGGIVSGLAQLADRAGRA